MIEPYLYINSDEEHAALFPCDLSELGYALKNIQESHMVEKWFSHGHGPLWRMRSAAFAAAQQPDMGCMVVHLETGKILTVEELKAMGMKFLEPYIGSM